MRVALLSLLVACEAAPSSPPGPGPIDQQIKVEPHTPSRVGLATSQGEVVVNVEVVSTPAKVQQGLMYREHLAPDAGMLFLMGYETDHAFYMRNTLIPLDMIFITKDLTIAGIVENAEPRTETLRRVGKTSLYVLEVNGGWTAAHHVAPGAKVRFENVTPQ